MKHLYIKNTLIILLFTVLFAWRASYVQASGETGQYGQYGQYTGSAGAGRVVVDKLVRNPVTGEYVDNLGLNDPKYAAQNAIFFKISVKNVGESTLDTVKAVDYLPSYIEFISGGEYDKNTRQILFTFDIVRPGEIRSTIFQTRVVTVDKMPSNKSVLCTVNKVAAFSPQDGRDEDTTQFCIEKKVMAESVPSTGDPVSLALGLGAIPVLFAGFKLRRKQ